MLKPHAAAIGAGLVALAGFAGCSSLRLAAAGPLIRDVTTASSKHPDVDLVTAAAPAFLLLLEGLLEGSPDNPGLLVAAAQSYTMYGALVELEDPERARLLYARGRDFGQRALARRKGVGPLLQAPYSRFAHITDRLEDEDLPAVFWAASSWGAWIASSPGSMAALAQLPRVVLLMEWVLARDESYYYASPHVFLGVYHAAVPPALGGDPESSRQHFERARELSEGKSLMVNVQMARFYARQIFDRDLYEVLLRQVLAAPADAVPELVLQNRVAQQMARQLLGEADANF
ncbi:MAG: TRAP transporter TatT component family protein [Gemmatimonadota bacterium]